MKRLSTLFLALALCWAGAAVAQDRLTFGVVSDIHVGSGTGEGAAVKVPRALHYLSGLARLDAMAIAGDLTNNGTEPQWQELAAILQDEATWAAPAGDLLLMMGNHDNYDAGGQGWYQEYLKPWNGGEAYPLNAYKVIKGHAFITVSMLTSGSGAYPAATVAWLSQMLEKAATECPGRPIFVFTHTPPMFGCYSTWGDWENGVTWGDRALNATLNNYPQAVVFGGHSHYPVGDPRSIHQGVNPSSPRNNYYTAVGTGSTTYSEVHPGAVDAGIHPEAYDNVTEGLIVEVLADGNVEIRRYDTTRGEEIGAARRWLIQAPFDGSMFAYADIRDADDNPQNRPYRDGLPAPVWPEDAEPEVEAGPYSAEVTIPQATDEECVFAYEVLVLDEKGMEVSKARVFSQHYLNSQMPATIKAVARGLRPERDYTLTVKAIDCYDNESETLTMEIETPEDDNPANQVPTPMARYTFDNPGGLLEAEEGSALVPANSGSRTIALRETADEAGIKAAPGPGMDNGAAYLPAKAGFKLPLTLDERSKNYTLQVDMMVPNINGYNCILQTELTNGNDGDLFYKDGKIGLAILSYQGKIEVNKWHRILMVNRDGLFHVYVDGQLISKATDDRFTINPEGVLIHIDEDGELKEAYISEVAFWNEPFSEGQVNHLGNIEMGDYLEVSTGNVLLMDELNFEFDITCNIEFQFELPEWIEGIDDTPELGAHTYEFRMKPMSEAGRREGYIKVTAAGMPDKLIRVGQVTSGGQVPEARGVWTFDDPENPLAGEGVCEMLPAYNTVDGNIVARSLDDAGIVVLEEGPMPGNGAIGSPALSYLWINTNLGDEPLTSYTLMMDVRPEKLAGFNSLYLNHTGASADGSLFIKNGGVGLSTQGLGYNGEMAEQTWHRIVAVVRDRWMYVYLDGERVGQSANASASLWDLHPQFLLFADNSGEEMWNDLAEVRLWDVPLTDEYVAMLGKVEQVYVEHDPLPEATTAWGMTDETNMLAGTGEAKLFFAKKGDDGRPRRVADAATAGIEILNDGPGGKKALRVPVDSYLQIEHGQEQTDVRSYSMMMDLRARQFGGYKSIYQNNPQNDSDGALFFKENKIGLNSAGLGYNGDFAAGEWYRVVWVVEGGAITVYCNGKQVGASSSSLDSWYLADGGLFFADENGEEGELDVAEIRFWNQPLAMSMVKELGKPSKEGPAAPTEPIPAAHTVWTFANPGNPLLGQGNAKLQAAIKDDNKMPRPVETIEEAGISTTTAPMGTTGALSIPVDSYLRFISPEEGKSYESYCVLMDIRVRQIGGFQNLYQNDTTNLSDGMLFVNGAQVGLNSQGLGYHGEILPMAWHRIVFSVKDCFITLYVDGEMVGASTGASEKWAMFDGALFFADENGEEGVIDVAEIRFWDQPLSDNVVGQLGKAGTATGITAPWMAPATHSIYDILGRRLAAPQPGLMIIDGQKVMVK